MPTGIFPRAPHIRDDYMNILLAIITIVGELPLVYLVAQMNEELIIYAIDFQLKAMKLWKVDAPHLQIAFRSD